MSETSAQNGSAFVDGNGANFAHDAQTTEVAQRATKPVLKLTGEGDSVSDKKRVTLRDVASAAGVSLKTASNVINNNGRMSSQTREKVHAVIEELGYRVNIQARNLNRGRTGFITLAVPSLTPPYLAELANRVIDVARTYEYSVYVTTYAEGSATGIRNLLQEFNTTVSDGMILSISEAETVKVEDLEVDYPLVCVGSRDTFGKSDHVTTNDVDSAQQATQYLFDKGAEDIAVIGARTTIEEARTATEGNAQLRLRGVLEACDSRGVAFNDSLLGSTGFDWAIGAGAAATQQLIDSGAPFDGIVAFNDQLAMGALFTLAANGISVPDRVQVIGFDNIEEAEYFQPPLTTMDSCIDWTAPTAVKRLIQRIEGEDLHAEKIETKSRVIARATTK